MFKEVRELRENLFANHEARMAELNKAMEELNAIIDNKEPTDNSVLNEISRGFDVDTVLEQTSKDLDDLLSDISK